jgi:transposase
MKITTIGLDLAKSVFQIHGIDTTGQVVVRKSLRRSQILPFFAKLPACWSASKRAAHRITGRAS